MRICSLLPSATEILYALGLGDQVVGVSHTCDYPTDARSKPVVTHSLRQVSHLGSRDIDAIIQQARANSNPVHWIDGDLLRELQPDLIVTQEICQVCAIGSGSVFETASQVLDYQPQIITSRPAGLEDIYQNIRNIGRAADVSERADDLIQSLSRRIERVQAGLEDIEQPQKVFCIDWLNPLRNTGQWTPELVELAGGVEGLAVKGGQTREVGWQEVLDYQPDYVMVMPCAFDLKRGGQEARDHLGSSPHWSSLEAVRRSQVYLFDGLIPSRHGPRVVDVLEGLAEAMYPERFPGLATPGVFQKADF